MPIEFRWINIWLTIDCCIQVRRRKDALRQKVCCRRWRHLQNAGAIEWVKTHSSRRRGERGGRQREREWKKLQKTIARYTFSLAVVFLLTFFLYFIIAPRRNTFSSSSLSFSRSCASNNDCCVRNAKKNVWLTCPTWMEERKRDRRGGKKDRKQAKERFIFMPIFLFWKVRALKVTRCRRRQRQWLRTISFVVRHRQWM